jgi:SurA-like N-terminal domain
LKAANDLEADVGPQEIIENLKNDRSFFRKGRFDPEQYRYVLANSRPPLTPEQYESNVRDDLSVDKVKRLVSDGIILTAAETAEAKATVKDPKLTPEKRAVAEDRAVQNALGLKKQRSLAAFIESMKSATPIDINDVLL